MVARHPASPAFGQADLSNCEREQIHRAGSIQPHGALLVISEPDHVIIQASDNAASFLGVDGEVLGRPFGVLAADLADRIRPHLDERLHELPIAVRCRIGRHETAFDLLLHRPPSGGLVIELEQAGPSVDLSNVVGKDLQTILACSSLRGLCDETAHLFKELTGYDRVMVYRFDDDGHGEVLSEQRESVLEPYLGNRYPASDIPQIARRLYERNRIRVLADVGYTAVPLTPRLSPITGEDLDMSLCFLRSMSPIHTQYLRNMGVAATLVASLVVGSRLWGLIACHHYVPRFVHFELRAVCELLAEAVATRIAALESVLQAQAELWVRRLEQRMVEAILREGDWRNALFDGPNGLLQPVGASGAALLFEGQVQTAGEVPGTQQLREIGQWLDKWLNKQPSGQVIATTSLGSDEPRFAPLIPVASGLLATPISTSPGEYLIWLRPEQVCTVTWGGNPFKPVLVGDDPSQLSPRRSFAQWHQLVEGTSSKWTPSDLAAARLIGETVADVVLQFRSVRLLIAQDQLESIRQQIQQSEQPVLIAGPEGRVLLSNEAFRRLLGVNRPEPHGIEDLLSFFTEASVARRGLRDLMQHFRSWRGEVCLETGLSGARPLLTRADPVFASPGRVLGFVLLFTDLTEQKAAEAARRRFQESIIEGRQILSRRLSSRASLLYRNLLSSIVENAELAALEITDGVDTAHIPDMLEGLRVSVARAAETLELLIWHATGSGGRGK